MPSLLVTMHEGYISGLVVDCRGKTVKKQHRAWLLLIAVPRTSWRPNTKEIKQACTIVEVNIAWFAATGRGNAHKCMKLRKVGIRNRGYSLLLSKLVTCHKMFRCCAFCCSVGILLCLVEVPVYFVDPRFLWSWFVSGQHYLVPVHNLRIQASSIGYHLAMHTCRV